MLRRERQGRCGASRSGAPAYHHPILTPSCLGWAGLAHFPPQHPSRAAQLWLSPRPGGVDCLWMLSIFSKNHHGWDWRVVGVERKSLANIGS